MVLEIFVLAVIGAGVYSAYKIISNFLKKKKENMTNYYLGTLIAGLTAITFPELAVPTIAFIATIEGIVSGLIVYVFYYYARGKSKAGVTIESHDSHAGHASHDSHAGHSDHDSHGGGHDAHGGGHDDHGHGGHDSHDSHAGHGGHDDHAKHDSHGHH
ncbi:hypothetical protein HUU53_04610 [Candidatus Micrarchaeota archaeon]|nr:hypothetical protein [Candidatus Micrarchaeota archaeon]